MGVECCDPLDLKRDACKQCPYLSECIARNTEEIQENFENNKESKNNSGRDKGDSL